MRLVVKPLCYKDSRSNERLFILLYLIVSNLSFLSAIEKLLGRNSSGSGLENRDSGRRVPSR
jgi:hypothetical protein